MDTKARPSRKKRRSWAFPLGLLVIVLVVAGVVAIVGAGVSGVKGDERGVSEVYCSCHYE